MTLLWTTEAMVEAMEGRPFGDLPEGVSGFTGYTCGFAVKRTVKGLLLFGGTYYITLQVLADHGLCESEH